MIFLILAMCAVSGFIISRPIVRALGLRCVIHLSRALVRAFQSASQVCCGVLRKARLSLLGNQEHQEAVAGRSKQTAISDSQATACHLQPRQGRMFPAGNKCLQRESCLWR